MNELRALIGCNARSTPGATMGATPGATPVHPTANGGRHTPLIPLALHTP